MRTDIRVKPQGPVLAAFYADKRRVPVIMGPLGSGKTIMTCQKILQKMCEQQPNSQGVRPSRWVAVRNTYPDLSNTTIKDWLGLFGSLGRFTNGSPPRQELSFRMDDGTYVEAEMLFLALDRQDDVKKLRGIQATGFWLNELKELPRSVVDMADLRHGRYPSMATGGTTCSWHGMIGDTNAWDEDHWLFESLSAGEPPPGWSFHRQPGGVIKVDGVWVENPEAENLANLPEGYYVNGMSNKREEWIKVNLGNEYGYVQDGRAIWPEYQDQVHCAAAPLEYDATLPIQIGIDFGLTPAAVFIQETASGQVRVIEEIVTQRMAANGLAAEIKQRLARARYSGEQNITGDPAGDQGAQTDETTPFQVLFANGVQAHPASTNDFMVRVEAVADLLGRFDTVGQPALLISPTCKHLRKGLAGAYCYRRIQVAAEERYRDKPDKNIYSHVCEALQYATLGMGHGTRVLTGRKGTGYDYSNFNADDFYDRSIR